jgi:hypothetical protein
MGNSNGWRKSSYSSSQGGSCVEVANTADVVGVRDTKQAHLGDARTVLSFAPGAWRAFLGKVTRAGG